MFIAGVLFVPAWLSLRNLQTDPANLIVIDATGASLGQRLRSNLTSTPPNASTTIDVRVTAPDGIAAAGASVNSEQEAQQALAPILVLIIASALFIQPVMLNPTSTLARVASMFPFSAPIIMPLRMSLVPIPPWEMAVAVAGLAVAFVAVILLAARIYRIGLLMYGKRPTFRERARWVRQS